jgi:hypothetical protein
MKSLTLRSLLAVAIAGCFAISTLAQAGAPTMKFDKTEYNFGKIPKEKPVTIEFKFTNTGTKGIIIEDATAECGCTKPEFPQQPIAAGKQGTIKVTYDAKTPGIFTKKVTVKLVNVAEPVILTIKGEVGT